MMDNDRLAGHRLIETATLVEFSIVGQSIEEGPDDAEFAVQVDLVFNAEDDEGIEAGDIAEWGAFGFMFVLGVLSFADGRPRESSIIEYAENDEFGVSDFLEHLRFRRGELHFYADYIRGRRLKTDVVVRKDGTATLQTFGRGQGGDSVAGEAPREEDDAGRETNLTRAPSGSPELSDSYVRKPP
jgi:hypothetical protein